MAEAAIGEQDAIIGAATEEGIALAVKLHAHEAGVLSTFNQGKGIAGTEEQRLGIDRVQRRHQHFDAQTALDLRQQRRIGDARGARNELSGTDLHDDLQEKE